MSETRVIKRYANRKLYDTQHSRYVTLDQIAEMIRGGDDVKIVDNKSKEDLTSVTLAQIIFEEEKRQKSFLPLQAMRNIIQSGGESITQLVHQAKGRVTQMLGQKREDARDDEHAHPEGDHVHGHTHGPPHGSIDESHAANNTASSTTPRTCRVKAITRGTSRTMDRRPAAACARACATCASSASS
jgi:polyhydroxyalkanoate synthesis repressor PhaR